MAQTQLYHAYCGMTKHNIQTLHLINQQYTVTIVNLHSLT